MDFSDAQEIFSLFTRVTGMHFNKKETITAEKIKNFCLRRDIYSFQDLHRRLADDSDLLQTLINHLTVNETFFFREMEQITLLKDLIHEKSSPCRILCAPCSSGEEVYSIIIQLLEAGITKNRFEIVGIDINTHAIERAVRGLYSERSVNQIDPRIKHTYFDQHHNLFELKETIRSMAIFRQENIFGDRFKSLGRFDYIFSRNLFIYFNEEEKNRAISIFCSMLNTGGNMFFGHADIFKEPECLSSRVVGKSRIYTKIS